MSEMSNNHAGCDKGDSCSVLSPLSLTDGAVMEVLDLLKLTDPPCYLLQVELLKITGCVSKAHLLKF